MPLLLSPSSRTVDAVMLEARAAGFAKRSIKNEAKLAAIDLAIRCIDLTTLEGRDSPGRVRSLCAKAAYPAPGAPRVAAVCVYPNLVGVAKAALQGTGVKVASVATAFPSGLSSLDVKLRDTEAALASGADEIDMVIDRGAFLSGRYLSVFEEIKAVKLACVRPDGTAAHLKVIFENGELSTYDNIRRASWLAM
ncbi:MAG: deoC, partial [Candidatus Eremiobacteraeota bacterium]|nr:deoC [Candidatus Eremiobacteraeota bacterium]